jgi:hypothetical protein
LNPDPTADLKHCVYLFKKNLMNSVSVYLFPRKTLALTFPDTSQFCANCYEKTRAEAKARVAMAGALSAVLDAQVVGVRVAIIRKLVITSYKMHGMFIANYVDTDRLV